MKVGILSILVILVMSKALLEQQFTTTSTMICILVGIIVLRKRLAKPLVPPEPLINRLQRLRARYALSDNGLLPSVCLQRLGDAYDAWEEIVAQLPDLNRTGKLRERVDSLPVLSDDLLATPSELRRAHVALGMLAHSYVHGSWAIWKKGDPAKSAPSPLPTLPASIGVPFLAVCERLQMPPVLTSTALDLWNWHLVDSNQGFVLDNIALNSSMTGTASEAAFHLIPCAIHRATADVYPEFLRIPEYLMRSDQQGTKTFFITAKRCLTDALSLLAQTPTRVDQWTFMNTQRPFLSGWDTTLRIDTGSNGFKEITYKGASAGQTPLFMLLDLVLGIDHAPNSLTTAFHKEMESYFPRPHRLLLEHLREALSKTKPRHLKQFVETEHRSLKPLYVECVTLLLDIRKLHAKIAKGFIPESSKGTGGTTFRDFLDETIVDTTAAITPNSYSVVAPSTNKKEE